MLWKVLLKLILKLQGKNMCRYRISEELYKYIPLEPDEDFTDFYEDYIDIIIPDSMDEEELDDECDL